MQDRRLRKMAYQKIVFSSLLFLFCAMLGSSTDCDPQDPGLYLLSAENDTYASVFTPTCKITNNAENMGVDVLTIFSLGRYYSNEDTQANISYICYKNGVEVLNNFDERILADGSNGDNYYYNHLSIVLDKTSTPTLLYSELICKFMGCFRSTTGKQHYLIPNTSCSTYLRQNECQFSPTNNCHGQANCTDVYNGTYTCECNPPFYGNGTTCQENHCLDMRFNDCHFHATCTHNDSERHSCSCNHGYIGDGHHCEDINECSNGTHNCDVNANCTNTPGGFNCSCNRGYTGNGTSCEDINECSTDTHNCDANANCTNTPGGFNCSCNSGYTGNGTSCEDINECFNGTHNCDANADCTNTPGGFNCICNTGYLGNGTSCKDINECSTDTHNCDANANCTNAPGGFNCSCNTGYTGNGTSCEDIDECRQILFDCTYLEYCENTLGSYKCVCREGHRRNGSICQDFNLYLISIGVVVVIVGLIISIIVFFVVRSCHKYHQQELEWKKIGVTLSEDTKSNEEHELKLFETAISNNHQEPDNLSRCENYPSLSMIQNILLTTLTDTINTDNTETGCHFTEEQHKTDLYLSRQHETMSYQLNLSNFQKFSHQVSATSDNSVYLTVSQGSMVDPTQSTEQVGITSVPKARSDEYLVTETATNKKVDHNAYMDITHISELIDQQDDVERASQDGEGDKLEFEDTGMNFLNGDEHTQVLHEDEHSTLKLTSIDGYIEQY